MATATAAMPTMRTNVPSSRPKPPARVNTSSTYTLAHTAQCKLKLAAKRTDRDLRFVLGHAFTLDNLMLRIVEIENREAKSAFTEGGGKRSSKDVSDAEGEHFDCSLAQPQTAPTSKEHHDDDDGDFDCTKAPPPSESNKAQQNVSGEAVGGGRRVSFQDNNARPSKNGYGSAGSRSPKKRRSPSPQLVLPAGLSDDSSDDEIAGTSSDDYEEPELMAYDCEAAPTVPEDKKALKKANLLRSRSGRTGKYARDDTYVDEEDAELELADDELDTNTDVDTDKLGDDVDGLGLDDDDGDGDGMGLTRFESASARPPRMVEDVEGDEYDVDDDGTGPESPPQLPVDVDVREIIGGEKDEELTDLYEKVRRCYCHGNRDVVGGKPEGIWDVPVEKTGGKRLAVVAVTA
ncbi:hypothetical protein LTS17_004081 [Exophiala oligosperma]